MSNIRIKQCSKQKSELKNMIYRSQGQDSVNTLLTHTVGFAGGPDGEESACSVGDLGAVPGLGRYPGEGNG